MADLKISALNSLAGADLVAADVVAVVDDSASETKKLTVSDLIANGTTLISDATIPSAKILFSAGAIDTAELAASAVETAKINDSAVTAAKLADNSSVTLVSTLPASGDFTGQIALDTDDDKIYIWDGSAWDSVKGAGSINVVNGSTSGIVNITTSTSGDTVTVSTSLDDTSAAANFLAGPTGAGGTVGYRAIAGSDLPKATTSTKGAVVVNGNGLTMSNDEIQINNSVTPETTNHHVVQYDANGLITAGRAITGADIPSATSSVKGSVFPGTGLAVTGAGELNHSNNITAGTFTKVTVDTEGHVTATTDLAASDIPDLPATKITTGTLPTERVANDAITADKLANESTTKFIGAGATDNVVTFPDGDFKGQFAYDEKNEDLYVYTGNSFIPITVISGNLVNAGTYNASTNLISSVTTAGSAAGFTSGGSLPTPATTNLNYYVVVDTSGTGSGAAPSVSLAPPDMLVSLGTGATFQLVDVSNAIAGQTAANISVVPVGSIAATDAQAAIQELDTEKLAKAGGTMTGNLELGDGIVIVFEGATANDYETTLTVTDPTADRTITLPDETGTVLTTGASGVVTSTMITDGTIVNADISASAEIAVSKLANGTARQLLQTDSTGADVEFTSNIDVPGTLDCTGAGTFDSSLTVTGVINADGKIKYPAGTAALPSLYSGSDTDTGIYSPGANQFGITIGGSQAIYINADRDVGISINNPSARLDVVDFAAGKIANFSNGNDADIEINCNTGGVSEIGPATASVLALQTSNTERLRIDSSGRLLVGTTSGTAAFAGDANNLVIVESGNTAKIVVHRKTEDAYGGNLRLGKTRSSTNAIDNNDEVGIIEFFGHDSTDTNSRLAHIGCYAEADGATNDVPGRIVLATTADGASSPTERVRIDSTGTLGIGTAGLTLQNNDGNYRGLQLGLGAFAFGRTNDTPLYLTSNLHRASSGWAYTESTTASLIAMGTNIVFSNAPSGTAGASVTPTERARIDSSGNVGVGTTSNGSSAKFEVKSTTGSISSATSRINGGSTTTGSINTGASLLFAGHDGSSERDFASLFAGKENGTSGNRAAYLAFGTRPDGGSLTERMRIDSSGMVKIGTGSTVTPDSNADDFVIDKGAADTGLSILSTTTGRIYFGDAADDEAGSIRYVHSDNSMRFETASSERMRIDSSGHITPGANGTQDLGSTSKRFANLYTSDLDLSNEAKGGNDVDGTWGAYTIQEGEEDLFLINKRSGKKYKFMLQEVS